MPDAVHKELCHPAAPLVVRDWAAGPPTWAEVTQVEAIDDATLLRFHQETMDELLNQQEGG